MANDPFASAPDEAQTTPPEAEAPQESPFDAPPAGAPEPTPEVKTEKPARPVAQGDGKVVLTFKGGSGYDAPWIVIHAADLQDAADQVEGENAMILAKIMEKVQKAGSHFSSLAPTKPSSGGNGGGQQRQGTPQGAQEAPGGEKRYCSHGEMQYKTGTSKAGKPWKAFMCPTPKGSADQCDAQWIR